MATKEERAIKILFVCSMNQWRSPTGEKIYSDRPMVLARSAGTNKKARKRVTSNDVEWADFVFVMEQKHKQRLTTEYPEEMRFKTIHVLDIPDEYQYMDPNLVNEILAAVDPILAQAEKDL